MTWPISDGVIMALTGPSGSGKTTAIGSLCKEYKVLVLDADGHARIRLREQMNAGTAVIRRISTYDAAIQAIVDIQDEKYPDVHVVAVDGLSLLSERIVRELAEIGNKDTPEKGERQSGSDRLRKIFSYTARLADPDEYPKPRHVIFTCLEGRWRVSEPPAGSGGFTSKRVTVLGDDGAIGSIHYGPLLPGKFADDFGAWMTEHFRVVVANPETGERALITSYDGQFNAKDGSGRLSFSEPADLCRVLDKILMKE